jgi:hypothetical protein
MNLDEALDGTTLHKTRATEGRGLTIEDPLGKRKAFHEIILQVGIEMI